MSNRLTFKGYSSYFGKVPGANRSQQVLIKRTLRHMNLGMRSKGHLFSVEGLAIYTLYSPCISKDGPKSKKCFEEIAAEITNQQLLR